MIDNAGLQQLLSQQIVIRPWQNAAVDGVHESIELTPKLDGIPEGLEAANITIPPGNSYNIFANAGIPLVVDPKFGVTGANTTISLADGHIPFVNGPSFTDVKQGQLGDCYFLAALVAAVERNHRKSLT